LNALETTAMLRPGPNSWRGGLANTARLKECEMCCNGLVVAYTAAALGAMSHKGGRAGAGEVSIHQKHLLGVGKDLSPLAFLMQGAVIAGEHPGQVGKACIRSWQP